MEQFRAVPPRPRLSLLSFFRLSGRRRPKTKTGKQTAQKKTKKTFYITLPPPPEGHSKQI
jgi:hypothetical protein